MSEMAPEPRQRSSGGLKGLLTRKLGPLPTWVWVLIVTAIILLWVVLRNRNASQQQTPSDTVGAGQVPQFVNQTQVLPQPPSAPDQDGDEDEDEDKGKPKPPGGGHGGPPTPGPVHHPKPPGRRHFPREPKPIRERPPHDVHGKVPGFGHRPRGRPKDPRMSPA